MSEKTSSDQATMWASNNLVSVFITQYGQLAFGVSSFLLIWFAVVNPQLQANRITFEQHEKLIKQMEIVSVGMKATSEILERTVRVLNVKNE